MNTPSNIRGKSSHHSGHVEATSVEATWTATHGSGMRPVDMSALYRPSKQSVDGPFLTVYAKTALGKRTMIRLNRDVTAEHFKDMYSVLDGLEAGRQRLLFNGKELDTGQFPVQDCGLKPEDALDVYTSID
ncbi:hypothetical protein BCR44DRAFT_177571 [Catenaria anguillulae PL171]|uniref:Ubiquitin-like domain-containing protein n=1 Tax=Catenaria anguillulae PL171 TaxID=765915 RepID=A0A1Y2I1M1_9FUNG|nr:hypothetical protein BCR44DRAFT_177571 [Catenaria anguillulae PL171]